MLDVDCRDFQPLSRDQLYQHNSKYLRVQSLSNSETVDFKTQIINGSWCTIDNMELMPTVSAELLYHAILQILQHLLPGLRYSVLEIPTPEGITRLKRHRKFHEMLKASFSIHWQTLVGWPVSLLYKSQTLFLWDSSTLKTLWLLTYLTLPTIFLLFRTVTLDHHVYLSNSGL